jgi:hypothetical protein
MITSASAQVAPACPDEGINVTAQQTLASAVIETLSEVGASDGPGVACQLAVSNIRASTHFLLHSIGNSSS